MPDWSYQPLLKPALFRLPPRRARDLTLASIGRLGQAPFGAAVIEAFGHMRPAAAVGKRVMGLDFVGPVGLGAGLDAGGSALVGLSRFGFGFVEAGPVTVEALRGPGPERIAAKAIRYPEPLANPGAASIEPTLRQFRPAVSLGIRIAALPGSSTEDARAQLTELARRFAPVVDYLALQWPEGRGSSSPSEPDGSAARLDLLRSVVEAAQGGEAARPVLVCIPPDLPQAALGPLLDAAVAAGLAGVVIGGGLADRTGRVVGGATREASMAMIRAIAPGWGDRLAIIGSGGILTPGDALAALDAGADLVQLHSGLVFSGPGLPKRINEALQWRARRTMAPRPETGPSRAPSWIAHLLLGLGMIMAGAAAWAVATTVVVLPYDLAFLGMTREQLAAVHPRLLPFMSHDRIALAGTMMTIGVLYSSLAWFGVRRGVHWARRSLAVSAVPGFASFFLFLAYGFFDPLHAALSAILLVLFLVGLRWPASGPPEVTAPDLDDDRGRARAMVAQLAMVTLGVGLAVGGLAIAALGSTAVFVPEDLEFMGTTDAYLRAANPRLPALIAHDRAGFGGALLAAGLAFLTMALWGVRRGARWLWWTVAAAGLPGLGGAIGVHLAVGYLDLWHLAPVLLAVVLYALAVALSREYLCVSADAVPEHLGARGHFKREA